MKTEAGNRLGTEKIGKLMLELALPSVLAQIVNVLYNIVDSIFVAQKEEKTDFQRGWFQDSAWIGYELYVDGFLFDPCTGK